MGGLKQKEAERRLPECGYSIPVLAKDERNSGLAQRREHRFQFVLVSSPPHAGHGPIVRLFLRSNEEDVAVAALHKPVAKFGFAERAEHGLDGDS